MKISNGNFDIKEISYQKNHNSNVCPNTVAFMKGSIVALLATNPTQKKDIDQGVQKSDAYLIDYDCENEKENTTNVGVIATPPFCVPFDFNGDKFL